MRVLSLVVSVGISLGCGGVVLPSSSSWARSFSGMSPVKVMPFNYGVLASKDIVLMRAFADYVVWPLQGLDEWDSEIICRAKAYISAIRWCPEL